MKKSISLFTMIMVALSIISCDSNKGKVEDQTKQLIACINNKDKATLGEMYREALNLSNMKIPKSIETGELSIDKDTAGFYVVSIANARKQKLVFAVDNDEQAKIFKMYSILELDSASTELAVKTGCPIKKIDDLSLSKLISEEGDFVKFLTNKYSDKISGNLVAGTGQWQCQGGWYPTVTVYQPIRNNGNTSIKGNEYNVEITYYCPNGSASSQTSVQEGVDLEPGEAYTYILSPGSAYYNSCRARDFDWIVYFTYKNQSPIQALLKYVRFTGKEYLEYLQQQVKGKKIDKNVNKSTNKKK